VPTATVLASGPAVETEGQRREPASRAARARREIAGFLSPEMSLAMHMLAQRQIGASRAAGRSI